MPRGPGTEPAGPAGPAGSAVPPAPVPSRDGAVRYTPARLFRACHGAEAPGTDGPGMDGPTAGKGPFDVSVTGSDDCDE
ncbi:hypothetical protein GCM10018953_62340 [Streptosporangium nondiastaticum]